MFPYPIAKPQKCDIQTFYGSGLSSNITLMSWNKPVGVSHVYMMLIGAGGTSADSAGGGSGAVTVWYGAAQHVPNNLVIQPAADQVLETRVFYSNRGSNYTLLVANSANGSIGAAGSVSPTAFGASGFFRSTDGQDGLGTTLAASTETFLSAGSSQNTANANYGYTNNNDGGDARGYFQMQPIIVGVGGCGGGGDQGQGGIGCGGARRFGVSSAGGAGMVLIASW